MEWLDEQGIEYQEIDAREMPDISSVPVTEINGKRIVGFDRPALKATLDGLKNQKAA